MANLSQGDCSEKRCRRCSAEKTCLTTIHQKVTKKESKDNLKNIFQEQLFGLENKHSLGLFEDKRPKIQKAKVKKLKKSNILKRLMSPKIGRGKNKLMFKTQPKSSVLKSRGYDSRKRQSPSAPTGRPRTGSTTFSKSRFSFCNRNHQNKLESIMSESENHGNSQVKLVSDAKLYMKKINKVFDKTLENINTSRMLRTSKGVLCTSLEEAYLEKLGEIKNEDKEVNKIISEYHYEVLHPDPKMVRLEIQCNKMKKKKLFSTGNP
ncbi:unnamed protein product [Moneuplotes crassus]|uniref:Uncharacterized protein n=1 Tax=Euplotes crassus TaxID=5936 RepID=A0AAD1U515_EUPCR|nr:unnamed protein product [Moneuplotes crassus]